MKFWRKTDRKLLSNWNSFQQHFIRNDLNKTYKNHVEYNYFIGNKMCKHLQQKQIIWAFNTLHYSTLYVQITQKILSDQRKKHSAAGSGPAGKVKRRGIIQIKFVAMHSIYLVWANKLGADIDWFQLKCIFPLLQKICSS